LAQARVILLMKGNVRRACRNNMSKMNSHVASMC
jgi:hypothetical protein